MAKQSLLELECQSLLVIGALASGMSLEDVMPEYELTAEQIQAALAYAATLVAQTEVVSLGA